MTGLLGADLLLNLFTSLNRAICSEMRKTLSPLQYCGLGSGDGSLSLQGRLALSLATCNSLRVRNTVMTERASDQDFRNDSK